MANFRWVYAPIKSSIIGFNPRNPLGMTTFQYRPSVPLTAATKYFYSWRSRARGNRSTTTRTENCIVQYVSMRNMKMNKASGQTQGQTKPDPLQASGILQRKCACCNHTVAGGEDKPMGSDTIDKLSGFDQISDALVLNL